VSLPSVVPRHWVEAPAPTLPPLLQGGPGSVHPLVDPKGGHEVPIPRRRISAIPVGRESHRGVDRGIRNNAPDPRVVRSVDPDREAPVRTWREGDVQRTWNALGPSDELRTGRMLK